MRFYSSNREKIEKLEEAVSQAKAEDNSNRMHVDTEGGTGGNLKEKKRGEEEAETWWGKERERGDACDDFSPSKTLQEWVDYVVNAPLLVGFHNFLLWYYEVDLNLF